MRVQWCQTITSSFKVCNGVTQGGVLSPIVFAVYVDSLLSRLEQSGVDCHICWCTSLCWWRYTCCAKSVRYTYSYQCLWTICTWLWHYIQWYQKSINVLRVYFLMFLLVAFMLMDNVLKFISVQCTFVIPYPQVTEHKLWSMQKGVLGVALIYLELILVIFPLDLKCIISKILLCFLWITFVAFRSDMSL